jgi:hypothetical protein
MLYKTGQEAPQTGRYEWAGYTDGTQWPLPTAEERVIDLERGERFPPINSCDKGAYWRLIY